MKFKFSVEFLIVVFLFLSIMFVSTYGSTKIIPYEHLNAKLPMFPYEGFSTYDALTNTIIKPVNEKPSVSITAPVSNYINNVEPKEENEKIDRLQKLHWGKYGNEQPIDAISGLHSNPSCVNISSGLSNSLGSLCPTENIQKLFKSRGGNAGGTPSQIGA
jgi:hypothetical protein